MTNTWKENVGKERHFSDLWVQKCQYIMGDHARIEQFTFPEKETKCGQGKDVLPQSDDYLGCQFNCIWNQQKHKPCTSPRGFLIIIFKADTLYIWATSSGDIPDESTQEKEIFAFCLLVLILTVKFISSVAGALFIPWY